MKDSAYKELINKEGRALPQEKKAAAADLFEKHFEKYQSYEQLYWTIWKMKQREKDIVDNAGLFLCDSMNNEIKELIKDNQHELNIPNLCCLFDNIYYLYFEGSEDGKEFEKKFSQSFSDDVKLTIYKSYLENYVAEQLKWNYIVKQQGPNRKIVVDENARKMGF